MSNDLVKQSIAELQDLVRCRCHPVYKDLGMHDPDCDCDSADAVQVVADRIEELEAKLEAVTTVRELMGHMWGDAEDKLEKAIGALEKVQAFVRDLEPHADQGHTLVPALREACETLAELKQGA
jgi:hypothetical protein